VSAIEVRRAGEQGALLELPDNAAAVRVARRLVSQCPGLVDVVPGHRTVLVTWGDEPPREELLALAEAALRDDQAALTGASVEIPVRYDGPDLDEVARLSALSQEEVAARHLQAEYVVGFLGFAPGFAYLLGGDERLRVERRAEPRELVPAGSVALAGPYSGIYPRESPGGWQLIGSTTTVLFDATRRPPALLSAGDRVRFVAA
jgi:KipI family sensor histidine kinase inhibitor